MTHEDYLDLIAFMYSADANGVQLHQTANSLLLVQNEILRGLLVLVIIFGLVRAVQSRPRRAK